MSDTNIILKTPAINTTDPEEVGKHLDLLDKMYAAVNDAKLCKKITATKEALVNGYLNAISTTK